MTARPPMRTPRRVPGFPPPQAGATQPEPTDASGVPPIATPIRTAGSRQLSIRVAQPLHLRYRHLLRDLEDVGIESSMTELVNALLQAGPVDAASAQKLLRSWRAADR